MAILVEIARFRLSISGDCSMKIGVPFWRSWGWRPVPSLPNTRV